MTSSATRTANAAFIAGVAAELTSRRPELAGAITTTDDGLALQRPAGGTIVVGQARFVCVLGWAVAGAGGALWPAAGEDVDGIAGEVLRRYDDPDPG